MTKIKKIRTTRTVSEEIGGDVKNPISIDEEEKKAITEDDCFPTGNTQLNLALSDNPFGGYGLGKVSNAIGDSSSGKTLLALTTLAECCLLERFNDYRLIYGDVEQANEFDVQYLFNSQIADRIEFDGVPDKVDEWYVKMWLLLKEDKPFIYFLDSLDSLATDEDIKKIEEKLKRYKKMEAGEEVGKKEKGNYGAQKPKTLSDMLRTVKGRLRKSNSAIVIISQTRDNIGFGAMFNPKTRSGGRALKFYSTHEYWMAVVKRIKKKEREIGIRVEAKVTKNKLTGKARTANIILYYDYGIDDITTNVEFLVNENYWKQKKQTIIATDLNFEGTQTKLIEYVEDKNLEKDLATIVGKRWAEIEEDIRLNRKSRY